MISESNQLQKGDLVKRIIASHYTHHRHSDAIGVVLASNFPIAKVYFYDTEKEEWWNQKVLSLVQKGDRC
jgi:hypothetical protein